MTTMKYDSKINMKIYVVQKKKNDKKYLFTNFIQGVSDAASGQRGKTGTFFKKIIIDHVLEPKKLILNSCISKAITAHFTYQI